MSRKTARKIEASPNLEHVNVKRNSAGTVQMTAVETTTGKTLTGTNAETTVFTTTANAPVCFHDAKITVKGGGAGNTATVKLTANGTTLLSTSGTGTSTSSVTGVTNTTPLNNPVFKLKLASNGGTATASLNTLNRDEKWA